MSYTYTLRWPHEAHTVQITGNFDNWAKSSEARKVGSGFEQIVRLDHKQRLVFKFVVDGEWALNRDYSTEWDGGVENNIVDADQLETHSEHGKNTEPGSSPELPPEASSSPSKHISDRAEACTDPDTTPAIIADATRAPSELVHTDEDLLSDFEDTPDGAGAKSAAATADTASRNDGLTNVSTSSSSFAGVSVLSSENDFHDIGDDHKHPVTLGEEDQFSTPTNSLFNSVVLPSSSAAAGAAPGSPEQPGSSNTANTSLANFNISSRNNSFTKPQLATKSSDSTIPKTSSEIVAILNAPGGYPSSPVDHKEEQFAARDSTGPGKRENLISRFKGLFKY